MKMEFPFLTRKGRKTRTKCGTSDLFSHLYSPSVHMDTRIFYLQVSLWTPALRCRKLHIPCGDFFTKVTGTLISLVFFCKRSRLLRLLACKRAHNAFIALPTFCGRACGAWRAFKSYNSTPTKAFKPEPFTNRWNVRVCCFFKKVK